MIPADNLPVETQASNNNVSILLADGTLFLAWRTAPTGAGSEMHVVSSTDDGATWTHEHTVALGSDVREPAPLLYEGCTATRQSRRRGARGRTRS